MKKIPMLFIKDDELLIDMYRSYFEAKGFRLAVIRGGEEKLERALAEGPSLITFEPDVLINKENNNSLVLMFTYQVKKETPKPEITSAVISSEVFSEIENSMCN